MNGMLIDLRSSSELLQTLAHVIQHGFSSPALATADAPLEAKPCSHIELPVASFGHAAAAETGPAPLRLLK